LPGDALSVQAPFPGGLAPTVADPSDPEYAGDLAQMAPGVAAALPSPFSGNPVRYFDGVVELSFTDLPAANTGVPLGLTRSWTNGANYASGVNGSGMVVTELPHLRQDTGGTLDAIANGSTIRYFDPNGSGGYTERYFALDQLAANPSGHTFALTDTLGDTITYSDFSSSWPAARQGTFAGYSDPAGNTVSVTSYTSDGKPAEIQFTPVGANLLTLSYQYSYLSSGVNAGLMSGAVLRYRPDSFDPWVTLRQVAYTYYDGVETHGNAGDLKTAVVEDGSGNALDTTYYRYYTGESGGYVHGLKYLFRPDSYGRLTAALGTSLSSLTDAQVAPYADNSFQYDSSQRVTQEVAAGAGSSTGSSPGLGTFTYSYTTSGNTPGLNSWAVKTVETLPDGNSHIVYTNAAAEVMLFVYHDAGSGSEWATFYEYDSLGHVILQAQPSAVSGYNDTYADLLHNQSGNYQYLSDSSGLITLYDYATSTTATSTTAGDAADYLQDTKVQQGETGTPILLSAEQYFQRSGDEGTIYPTATQTAYRNTNGTGGETTSSSYTWQGSSDQEASAAVSRPVISSGQDGPGSADVTTTEYDAYGRPTWVMDPDGYISGTDYDPLTGAVTETVTDYDTSGLGGFGFSPPSSWSTPSGGGLNLVTTYQVDVLGRTTEETDSNGNVSYTVYDDVDHEVRTYRGWNSTTDTPTGPTEVVRDDRAGGYTEALSMSATPGVTGGVPDGTEAIGGVQTLSRSYTNSGGQVTETDAYFNLSGLTYTTGALGTAGTNYYATTYGYDSDGRPARVQAPTGTIDRTVYDGQGRVVSTWAGTDDTPASGSWSPTNNTSPSNMVQRTADAYDGGGVGDGDLTQVTQYPGNGAAVRVTQDWYDWRDRLVASKGGVQASESDGTHRPITYNTYDNLGEVTEVQRYDGNGVTITTSGGVPQAPSASLLRAQTVTSYDDQGRVYQAQQYSVDPTSGTVSTYALTTNDYYNHRGELIEESDPGSAVTKESYDGAGRVTVTYTTDGGSGTTWADAGGVSGDNVLQQVEDTYDADGNAIATATRQRFHNETATGALGDPTTAPEARVSYTASYFDAANRLTAAVDVGTNGGTAWTRPATVPAPSDTLLVASTAYTPAGFVDSTTDPRGIVTKDFYDSLGRVTKTVAAYDGGAETNSTDVATEYTYDGGGHTLTVQADLPGGTYQRTQYVYGVTTATGSAINSSDILAAVQYPDPVTGNPSSSQQETYTADALGETLAKADRDGNVHTDTYDVLGRQTADAVTTLGSGVDGSVRRIQTAYDSQGNPYLVTSYNAASGGSIVNQVQDVFNGLGQLTGEYQSHSGAVNTSTTPEVQYGYTLMAGGGNNSRLTSITYPNGRVVSYNYNSGLDSSISRLSSLSDSSGTLQTYSYLGLGTVVVMADPQAGIALTYVQQPGDTYANHDGGDQYTGLDRFGRVIDQFWLNTGTGQATDRFQYGYDRDGNVLYKNNLVNSSFSELYHSNGAGSGYDSLNCDPTVHR
jgi:YD repeat-containing protein